MIWCNGYQTLAQQIKTLRKPLQKHYDLLEDSNLNLFLSHSCVSTIFPLFDTEYASEDHRAQSESFFG